MSKKVTIRQSLKFELNELIKSSDININNTGNEAKAYWVGYNQAIKDIRSRFLSSKKKTS